jgi:hypothetical protein
MSENYEDARRYEARKMNLLSRIERLKSTFPNDATLQHIDTSVLAGHVTEEVINIWDRYAQALESAHSLVKKLEPTDISDDDYRQLREIYDEGKVIADGCDRETRVENINESLLAFYAWIRNRLTIFSLLKVTDKNNFVKYLADTKTEVEREYGLV